MPQSLVQNYLHIIFSTKHREPLIFPPYEDELYTYIAGTCKRLECFPLKVGGYVDHVNILCSLSRKIALVKLMEDMKSNSSKWIKTVDPSLENFYWQDGFGAFSVSASKVPKVIDYIGNQHEHHRTKTFQDEFRRFLKLYSVEYDERYVWD
jgi:REP element-mobilizing transposase RayT